jgi:hypothetical protein
LLNKLEINKMYHAGIIQARVAAENGYSSHTAIDKQLRAIHLALQESIN